MKHLQILLVAVSTLCLASHAADSKASGEWRNLPLIKQDKVDPAWTMIGYGEMAVDGDALRTEPDPRGLGLLVYNKERLGNCQIKIVFKTRDERSNSGIYVRIADGVLDQKNTPGAAFQRDAKGTPTDASMAKVKESAEREEGAWFGVHRGYEVQIAGGGDPLHSTGSIYSLAPSSAVARPGEWQTMVITLDGPRIAVELDGKAVSNLDTSSPNLPARKQWHEPKREPKRPEVGYFGLQTHDPGDVVWYREISVRPLKK